MAYIPQGKDIDIARRARAWAREKMAAHIGTGNLTRAGREKALVSPTPQARPKSTAALRLEYGNGREKTVEQIEREVVGETFFLRGKARAVTAAERNVGQKKQALKLQSTLTVPMARHARLANKDGATSFHFKHEAIAKTNVERTSATGTKTRQHAGRDHSKYLERDSAVARESELAETGGSLAYQIRKADGFGQAAAGGTYIEREEALAHQENGVAVLYSNISQDDAEIRHQFWEAVEDYETEPNPDELKIVTGQDPEFWEAVRMDARCPPQLAQAIEASDPYLKFRVKTDDNQFIREILADHGWLPPSPSKPDETDAQKAARKRLDQENSKGATCIDGRGGRIQNRIIGELPVEVSQEQRVRILRRFADDFDEMRLPYVAVMHAPDHANNDKNWHFHLAYYERPCSRFTCKAEDHLRYEPMGKATRQHAQYRIKKKALESGELKEHIGKWDFAVPVTYKKTVSRNTVVSNPFAQDRLRACNLRDWPMKLRKRLAEITNDELEIAGVDRRVDPRKYTEMGIDKKAEKHLGSRSAQMETLGIATPTGVENEHNQWQYTLDGIEKKFDADLRTTVNDDRKLRQSLESRDLNASDQGKLSRQITTWAKARSEADEMTAIATELKEHLERARSRASQVETTCKQVLEAIKAGRANKRQTGSRADYEARLMEATDHLSGLTIMMAAEIENEKRIREDAVRLRSAADQLRKAIDDRLKSELAAMVAVSNLRSRNDLERSSPGSKKMLANDDFEIDATPAIGDSQSSHALAQGNVERFTTQLVEKNRRLMDDGNPAAISTTLGGRKPGEAGLAPPPASSSTLDPVAPSLAKKPAHPTSQTEVMRTIDILSAGTTQIILETKAERAFYRLTEQEMKTRGLANRDIETGPVQARLRGIYQQQESEIKRLVGFVQSSPKRTISGPSSSPSTDQAIIMLGRAAPPELQDLSKKYAHHPVAQKLMSEAVRRSGAEQEKVANPVELKASTENAPQSKAGPAKSERSPEAAKPVANCVDPNSSGGIEISEPIDRRSEPLGTASARKDEQDQPESAAMQVEHPAPGTPRSDQSAEGNLPADKATSRAAAQEQVQVTRLSEEEKKEILRPRKLGMQIGNDPARIAVKGNETSQDNLSPAKDFRGAHPLIDAWIDARNARDRPARQVAALAFKNDRKALKIGLKILDPMTQVRIRNDWEAQQLKVQREQDDIRRKREAQEVA